MTIEVVREALLNFETEEGFAAVAADALAALDSLEAELARLTKERDAVDRDGTEWRDACWKAEAELAQAREERDRMIEVTAEHPERSYTWYAEMRRYREALERIAAKDYDRPLNAEGIARAALTEETE